jgi:DNA replication protein DnaC
VAKRPEPGAREPCPLGACDGSGWVLGPEDVARPCECRSRIVARARLSGVASVIPAKYRGVSFDRPPVTQMNEIVVRRVREYCQAIERNLADGRGLWIYGSAGTGKTTLAMLVSRIALEAGRSVAIYSLPKLLARIRRTYDADAGEQSYSELFERLAGVDLLHIDDLGAEKQTEWVLEQLYALVNERYEAQRSLVVTTNHDESELEEQIGARVVSRLAEMCDTLPLFDEDQRWRAPDMASSLGESSSGGGGMPLGGGLGALDH